MAMTDNVVYKGFDELEKLGIESDYIRMETIDGIRYCTPAFGPEYAEYFAIKGDKVEFLNFNGYDYQLERVRQLGIVEGDVLTVTRVRIGNSSSVYTFEEIDGEHNTVMFKKVLQTNE